MIPVKRDAMSTDERQPPILVTGAGRRVGAHIAHRLLETGRGVIAHYRTPTEELEALVQRGATALHADFSGADAIRAFADAVAEATPTLSGIVHNASSFGRTPADDDEAVADFQRYYTGHMLTPWLLTRLLAPRLANDAETPADLVFITDIYADRPSPDHDIYCATKAGLQSLALSAAQRYAPAVKANVIQPGPIRFAPWHSDRERREILARTLLAREGGEDAIWQALVGILANPFMTGAVIPVDGGKRLR